MMTQRENTQIKLHCITLEDLVPEDHLLRKLAAMVDFSFIYDEVRDLYNQTTGRPSIDPVVLIKYLLIGFLYGIESERRIEQEIQVNMAYRWFLGLDIGDRVPDHSTISQNRSRRFKGKELYRKLFERVLIVCIEQGLVSGKLILTDSTHVKANASKKTECRVTVEKEAAWYMERLDKYEGLERKRLEGLGKIKPKKEASEKGDRQEFAERTMSPTDPESGRLNRPGKPEGMHYLDHQSIDAKNGIIVDVAVTAGNATDATPYLDRIEYLQGHIGLNIESVGVDSAYDVSLVHQELSEKGIGVFTPTNEEKPRYKVEFHRDDFTYRQDEDTYLCPNGKTLKVGRLQRTEYGVYREYRSDRKDCKGCPLRDKCLSQSQAERRIQVNIFEDAVKGNHIRDGTPEHKEVLDLRQIWCEGTFAMQKARHNLRSLFRRGLEVAEG